MTETKKIDIQAGNIVIEGYQDEGGLILLTHRQIGEIVGKSKAVAQRFLKQRENQLPSTIKASIPSRKGKIALTQWQSAKVFWQSQAEKGNTIALDLINAIADIPYADLKVTTKIDNTIVDQESRFVSNVSSFNIIVEGIEVASNWMISAGIDEKAIAAWKLIELGKQIPALEGVVNSALETITSETSSPTGMITTQLAKELSTKLGKKVTPAKVNQGLHDLELQEWAKPGINRERKLTAKGREYGIALLTTSADGWQGAQLRWYESVIPLLCNYFST